MGISNLVYIGETSPPSLSRGQALTLPRRERELRELYVGGRTMPHYVYVAAQDDNKVGIYTMGRRHRRTDPPG